MTTGAISLHAPRGARMTSVVVAFERFLDRKGIISVVAGRVLAGPGVGHCCECPTNTRTLPPGYPHRTAGFQTRRANLRRSDIVAKIETEEFRYDHAAKRSIFKG